MDTHRKAACHPHHAPITYKHTYKHHSPACSHVMGRIVLPDNVVVESVRNVVKLALGQAANEALRQHLVGQRVLLVSQLPEGINDQT